MSAKLESLLRSARKHSVEYPYCLANHAPMVLIILDQMGASDRQMANWYERYSTDHGLVMAPPATQGINAHTWRESLGERAREADYRRFFEAETERLGIAAVIRLYLPSLIGGVAASALHPLMRLTYGVLAQNQAEVGTALGYWAACHLPLPSPLRLNKASPKSKRPTPKPPISTEDPADILAKVTTIDGIRDYQTDTDLLWHHIRAVGALPGFAPLIGQLCFTRSTPQHMAAIALGLYAVTLDFAALHAVTSLHWARLVSPYLDDPEPLYRALWQVIAALVPKIGFPALPSADQLNEMRQSPAPPWPDIIAAALASQDEHDVSLAFSAAQEDRVWRDDLYRVVAARRLGLIE